MEKKFNQVKPVVGWEIETPSGFVDVINVMQAATMDEWKIETLDGHHLNAADTHILIDEDNNETFMRDLEVGQRIKTRGDRPFGQG